MRRFLAGLFLLVFSAIAANVKLYLKDGSFQLVREYHVEQDRVRFYTVERSQWEEIPVDLVDLKRTQDEQSERKARLDQEAKELSEEDKAMRAQEDLIMRIPQNPGVYYMVGKEARKLYPAESTVHTNKGRSVLKIMSPIPVVSGKATLEIPDTKSHNIINTTTPEFYIQLSAGERFGIIKLTPEHNVRIVEKITTVPVTKEVVEEPVEVQTFQKQLTSNDLYKIWPEKDLESGEYAVVEYTPGKMNMQVWDFRVDPGAPAPVIWVDPQYKLGQKVYGTKNY